ncbi:hypothetical protein [Autumnicola musiva]|uniref:ATP-binding protein n=1 Tax=Autumnicola musiva TaxID=3075589 RepID=A0ABU3D0P4_9FLAO|nr:hypothetical protein [Zunongwangia sp. F117]MDT0675116.1 hypothetical protein [Zunongwangia sp. F117]
MGNKGYIKAYGIHYIGALSKIKKNDKFLQPIFEAITNSLESIRILKKKTGINRGPQINLKLYFTKNLLSEEDKKYNFEKLEITDTGIGFDDTEFERLIALNNDEKGFFNKGTGRVQFLHNFNKTKVVSFFRDETSLTGFRERIFTLSKSKPFMKENSIIRLEEGNFNEIKTNNSFTSLTFEGLLEERDKSFYDSLTVAELKEQILTHYLAYFCENRENLPRILITPIINNKPGESLEIMSEDIPIPDKEENVIVHYCTMQEGQVKKTSKKETLKLKAFKLSAEKLERNELKLVSKGELANNIKLENLLAQDEIDGNRYLFLLSGDYIDERDSDTRGKIRIPQKKEFKKRDSLEIFEDEEILLEDIEEKTNNVILSIYDEIKKHIEDKQKNIKQLQKMFLLNPRILDSVRNKIKIGDSDDVILRKVYEAEAKLTADGDAELKKQIEALSHLNTSHPDYNRVLMQQVEEVVRAIPLQNRTALTHYVARRQLVLELFNKIIRKELDIQKDSKKNMDEKLMHNLIFQQSTDDTEHSDLWLLNEEYIYFRGTSEGQLNKISIDGEPILKEVLTEEEDEYRLKQQGDANQKRPDILLFPKEGKCIIIELKSLDTNISEHLNQINRYASLINNLSKEKYNFHTYYGYLIGENIDIDDIEDNDSDFKPAHQLNFLFRPHKRIVGKFGKNDGALYTEVIKYSTILERALVRNEVFIQKLTTPIKPNKDHSIKVTTETVDLSELAKR